MDDKLIQSHQDWYLTLVNISNRCIHLLSKMKNINKPVVVFDIDNTLLDKNNKVIEPLRAVYYYCIMIGITTAIITSRSGNEKTINMTKQQLSDAFIGEIGFFYFRKPGNKNPYSSKEKARKNIEERGYKIVMSIGDQQYDISGDCCGIPIQIPVLSDIDSSYIIV
jgi:predicted secreted acid phosphatase